MTKGHITIHGKKSKRLKLNIDPAADFREVLKVLESLSFPAYIQNQENIKYAVLELLNNSLRAHREKNEKKEIITSFDVSNNHLDLRIKDFGGGFDPQVLPYDLEKDHTAIDHASEEFIEYQKRHNYLRFGMGLLIVKRTFARFRLIFFDFEGKPTEWKAGSVQGTIVEASTGVDPNE